MMALFGCRLSRFGPTRPTALDAFSVWQVEQYFAKTARPAVCDALRSTPPGAFSAWLSRLTRATASGTATPRPTTTTATATPTIVRPRRDDVRLRRRAPAGPLENARKSTDRPSVMNA